MPIGGSKSAAARKEKAAAEQQMRNELYAGATPPGPATGPTTTQSPEKKELTTEQLIKQAQTTHQDTTVTAQRALKVLEDTKQIQKATMVELNNQSKKLDNIDSHVNKLNDDLTYSEKLLRYMRRCCCCWMCDSCTGADPEERKKEKWNSNVDKGKTQLISTGATTGPAAGISHAKVHYVRKGEKGIVEEKEQKPAPRSGDPDIRLDGKHGAIETAMHAETRKQNEIFDQLGAGLDELMEGSKAINRGLEHQSEVVDSIMNKTDRTAGRVMDMNTHSQLGQFKVKKK